MEGNGQNDHESRLNRLEEWFQRMQDGHEEFEKEHKRLLIAQVVMQDNLVKMQGGLEETRVLVHEIGDKLNGLLDWSNQVHRDNNERFKRLEEKQ
jgi:hypothetical protein